jgi:ribokinase
MLSTEVLCIGSATVDHFLTVNVPFKKIKLGDKVLVTKVEVHSGGGATNAAAALSRLGLKVKVLTKLGNDHAADIVRKELKQFKVKNICKCASRKDTDSATIISSTKERDRVIYVHKGASQDLRLTDCKKHQLRGKWIYLSSLIGESFATAQEIAIRVKRKKQNLIFNPSLYLARKGKKYLQDILEATTILVLNREEAQALVGHVQPLALLRRLQKLGPNVVVITDGPRKLYARKDSATYSLIPPDIKVVHTAGAGDAFNAGLLAGIIKKYKFADALRLGEVNACSVVQHIGTKNKLLKLKEAHAAMEFFKIEVVEK